MNKLEIEIVTHYEKNDVHFMGDYCGGEIIINGEIAETFYDHYHENRDFDDGFVDGVEWLASQLNIPVTIENNKVADY